MQPPTVIGPVAPEVATALFADLAGQGHITFRYVREGCYARAHLMVKRLVELGFKPGKAWMFAQGYPINTDLLWVDHPGPPSEVVRWRYHVAPILSVREADDGTRDMVLDPSLFDRVVTIEKWREAQHDTPTLVLTALGQPPIAALGGTGYWPGSDPLEGMDEHALETMDQCRRKLGG